MFLAANFMKTFAKDLECHTKGVALDSCFRDGARFAGVVCDPCASQSVFVRADGGRSGACCILLCTAVFSLDNTSDRLSAFAENGKDEQGLLPCISVCNKKHPLRENFA